MQNRAMDSYKFFHMSKAIEKCHKTVTLNMRSLSMACSANTVERDLEGWEVNSDKSSNE
jgi:hypothetical protein